ncbi:MAG TPA: cytochrome c peroxidase, partial [Telluria sp.]|nr:cytochrome c peroxidase [Telluria sp.]
MKRTNLLRGFVLVLLLGGAVLAAALPREEWSTEERELLASMRLSALEPAQPDPTNAVENKQEAVELGRRLFFDTRLSGNGAVSCASCHDPKQQFQDGKRFGEGVGTGVRRTMPVIEAGRSPFLFWDGRKDSLWAQALGPLEDAAEHGGNRLAYAHLVQAHYREQYQAVFGAMPDLTGLPAAASPVGTPGQRQAWEALDERTRLEVSRVFANMGKAIAAYEKTLHYGETRMDKYIDAVAARDRAGQELLDRSEKNGLRIFIGKGACVTCHSGPLLTDQHFHNTGIAPHGPLEKTLGRLAGAQKVLEDEFNCTGKFSDAPQQCDELRFLSVDDPALAGAYKTPSLRNVALRPPY